MSKVICAWEISEYEDLASDYPGYSIMYESLIGIFSSKDLAMNGIRNRMKDIGYPDAICESVSIEVNGEMVCPDSTGVEFDSFDVLEYRFSLTEETLDKLRNI